MEATTRTDHPTTGRYFLGFTFGVFLAFAGVLALLMFLFRAGEITAYADIAKEQLSTDAVYAPASSFDYFTYKIEMVRQAQPEILVLGSSRALGFQGRYLRSSFMNAGLGMRSVEQGQRFIDEVVRLTSPKLVIFTLDFWWFLPPLPEQPPTDPGFTPDLLMLPVSAVMKGQLTPRQLISVTLFGDRHNAMTNYDNLGIAAIASSTGVRSDGSQLYAEYAFGGRSDLDPRFDNTAAQIAAGTSNYRWSEKVYEPSVEQMKALIRSLQARGVRVAAVLPPVSPTVFRMMQESGKYSYIDELRRRFGEFGIPIADFHDPQSIPAIDCEFVDGYHGGDITYLKMLLTIARNWDWLAPLVDVETASATIADFDGNIIDQSDAGKFNGRPEVDFLGMGCTRRPSRPG